MGGALFRPIREITERDEKDMGGQKLTETEKIHQVSRQMARGGTPYRRGDGRGSL